MIVCNFEGIGVENWSNVKVPHLAAQGVSTEFVLIVGFGHADGESLLYIGIFFQ